MFCTSLLYTLYLIYSRNLVISYMRSAKVSITLYAIGSDLKWEIKAILCVLGLKDFEASCIG